MLSFQKDITWQQSRDWSEDMLNQKQGKQLGSNWDKAGKK